MSVLRTVHTIDAGPVEFVEPFWCSGLHPDGGYKADIAHQGDEVAFAVDTACHGEIRVLSASLYQALYAETESRDIVVAVEFGDPFDSGSHPMGAADIAGFADGLVAFVAGDLHQLIERHQLLLAGDES